MRFSSENNKGIAQIVIIIGTILILASIPLTIFLVRQRQEIRKKAAAHEGYVTCNPGTNRYDSNSITVTNRTQQTQTFTIQENLCDYTGQSTPLTDGDKCNNYSNSYQQSVASGITHTFSMVIPDCKIGQLDVYYGCTYLYDSSEQRWDGSFAFALKANRGNYDPATGRCPTATFSPAATATPTRTPTPTTPSGTPTRTPTATPTGSRTPTPTGTRTPTPTNTLIPTSPPGTQPTATPTPPVTGNLAPTIITVIVGGLLLLVGLAL